MDRLRMPYSPDGQEEKVEPRISRTDTPRYAWAVLGIGTFIVFGALGLARFGYGLILPDMQKALDLTHTNVGGLATANLVGYLLLSITGGALASRFGARVVVTAGMAVVGMGMLMTGAAGTFWAALVWRTVTGLGSGASNVPVMGLVASWFGPGMRGLATGIGVSGSSIGLVVTGPLVPWISSRFPETGWRVSWYVFGTAALFLALLGGILIRNRPGTGGVRTGKPGGGKLNWSSVYRSPEVWHLGGVYGAFGFAYIIYVTFFFRYMTGELGRSAEAAGNLYMLMGWCSMGCGVFWGMLSDRIGRKWALVLVFVIQALAMGIFALKPAGPAAALSAVLFGLTAWSIPAVMAAACGDIVGRRLAPAALGFVTLFFGIGQSAGPLIAGMIADATGSYSNAFVLSAAVSLLGGAGALFLKTNTDAQE